MQRVLTYFLVYNKSHSALNDTIHVTEDSAARWLELTFLIRSGFIKHEKVWTESNKFLFTKHRNLIAAPDYWLRTRTNVATRKKQSSDPDIHSWNRLEFNQAAFLFVCEFYFILVAWIQQRRHTPRHWICSPVPSLHSLWPLHCTFGFIRTGSY